MPASRSLLKYAVAALLALSQLASAQSVPLGNPIVIGGVGGSGHSSDLAKSLIGIQFFLGFDLSGFPSYLIGYSIGSFSGSVNKVDNASLMRMIGSDLVLSPGQVGTYEFSSTTSLAFNGVVARLTDGIDAPFVSAGVFGFNPDQVITAGSALSSRESALLGVRNGTDLVGNQIDFIRLTVTDLDVGPTPADPGRWSFSARGIWQVYGTPSPVPEPRCGFLFLIGGSFMIAYGYCSAIAMRRRSREDPRHILRAYP